VYNEDLEYELIFESEPDVEYESEPEPKYEEVYEAEYGTGTPPQRSYTEPIVDLNDRIAELGRRLRKESLRKVSPNSLKMNSSLTKRAKSQLKSVSRPVKQPYRLHEELP
jgi:hypothetical protein